MPRPPFLLNQKTYGTDRIRAVAPEEQTLQIQQDALTTAGCARIFTDTVAGATPERPGLVEALDCLRNGDTLVVWKLDRLGRTMKQLIATVTGAGVAHMPSRQPGSVALPRLWDHPPRIRLPEHRPTLDENQFLRLLARTYL